MHECFHYMLILNQVVDIILCRRGCNIILVMCLTQVMRFVFCNDCPYILS